MVSIENFVGRIKWHNKCLFILFREISERLRNVPGYWMGQSVEQSRDDFKNVPDYQIKFLVEAFFKVFFINKI